MNFTEEQQKVISLRNRNLLVSAAAGSGKTAVLVERIISEITDESKRLDIDHILVMTFTKSAAAEMKERIEAAIYNKLKQRKELSHSMASHLKKQTILIHNANITTIDSFCTSILRNHFNKIQLDPSFRVADEGELKLLRQDVLEEVLENAYEEKSEQFFQFVEAYSTKKNDSDIEEAIFRLYDYSQSKPFPEEWLMNCNKNYTCSSVEELLQEKISGVLFSHMFEKIESCRKGIIMNLSICNKPDGPYMYADALEKELEAFEKLCQKLPTKEESFTAEKFAEISSGIQDVIGNREAFSRKSDSSVSEEKKNFLKSAKAERKKVLETIQKKCFYTNAEQMLSDIKSCKVCVEELCKLTIIFEQGFTKAKRERGIVDFGDLEHLALQVLYDRKENQIVISKEAIQYRDFFAEVLVDEYQDSNLVQEYLLQAITRKEPGEHNLFMVGDVKQSIYKFRLAKPELFMDKYESYQIQDNLENQRIDLHKNFRSRKEVIETVNFFFEQIMRKEIGGIDYDDQCALAQGADYSFEDGNNESELILIEPDESIEDRILEAKAVALRIKTLLKEFRVQDKNSGIPRAAKLQDIVILLRTTSGWDEVFKKTLEEEGIPCAISSRTGYFQSYEIRSLLNYLQVLNNPRNEYGLAAVLKGPFGNFSDEELAQIRIFAPEGNYYDAVVSYAKEECGSHATAFLEQMGQYREILTYTPIHKLLEKIIFDFHFDLRIRSMKGGEKRIQNLSMLLQKATDFEKTSYQGLFHFVRYMSLLKKYEVDYGCAADNLENDNVVRIMSIHKSKGLEFPICFLCGVSKQFNKSDIRARLILDAEEGIGMDFVDPVLRTKANTIIKNAMIENQDTDNLGEELRVLYVALTRAREKLIITGVISDESLQKKKNGRLCDILCSSEQRIDSVILRSANSFLDLILMAGIRMMEGNDINVPLAVFQWGAEKLIVKTIEEQIKSQERKEKLLFMMNKENFSEQEKQAFTEYKKRFSWKYPFEESHMIQTKFSVSEIKHAHMEELESVSLIHHHEEGEPLPNFIMEKTAVPIQGALRGDAYHRVMELLDFSEEFSDTGMRKQILQFVQKGFLKQQEVDVVEIKDLQCFFETNLAKRMREAFSQNKLFREQPFVIARPANEINEEYAEDESVLVQGIIDVYFEEEDGLVVADYKTDRVKKASELIDRYQVQLLYYAKALEQLTGKKVKQCIIYSFTLGKEIIF